MEDRARETAMSQLTTTIDRDCLGRILSTTARAGKQAMVGVEAKAFAEALGLPTPPHRIARTLDEAVAAAEALGYPVVIKILSPQILHKTEVGGVRVGIQTPAELRKAREQMFQEVPRRAPEAKVEGVLVEAMAPPGLEVILGGIRDPQFGPAVLFGLGGIHVELLQDVAYALAPLTMEEAQVLLRQIKGYPLLSGFRGAPPLDTAWLAEALVRLGEALETFPLVKEIDLNPVLVYPTGAMIVDARVVIG